MSNHLSLVNQKLGFATAILFLADNASDATAGQQFQRQAAYESSLLHLYTAFHFYLRELAENNGIKNPETINSLGELSSSLHELGKCPSEVVELQELENREGSWLRDVLRYHLQVFKSPPKKIEKKAFGAENFIEVVDLTQVEPVHTALNSELLKNWIGEFKTMVLRQRQTGAEY
ncbi:DUF6586 family protein [Cellvibrio mixtus]|uniref:DUF6586 family protein n=1 Tax=Cellvibrio mixtus TaxID=39650 RepID=UPI000587224B|nr:DUF6586 family protein [Cellvibrio mixtus]